MITLQISGDYEEVNQFYSRLKEDYKVKISFVHNAIQDKSNYMKKYLQVTPSKKGLIIDEKC